MLIKVKVFPNSKTEKIVQKSEDEIQIWVKEKPLRGEANKRVALVLASYFGILKGKVRLVKGSKQKNKIFEIIEK